MMEFLKKLSNISSLAKLVLRAAKFIAKIVDKGAPEIIAVATAICLLVSYWAFKQRGVPLYRNVFIASAAAAILCFAGLVWLLVWLLRKKKGEIKDRKPIVAIPTVIKYGTAFEVSDGEIFKRLKRSNELRQLRAFANNEKSAATVLRGKSGSGKTSLLRAGLEYSLKQDKVECVYLEAKPDNTYLEFIKSIESFVANKPDRRLVVIIDEFEHLHKEAPEHRPFFDFVRAVCHAPPPHRVHLVIAFNDEYSDEWVKFETAEHLLIHKITLKLFSAEEGNEIIEIMFHEANLTVEEGAIRQYVQTVANDEGISPVAIGIGLAVMAKWAQLQKITAATFAHVKAEGIFTEYVRHWIEDYIQEDEQEIFLASLQKALVSAEGNIIVIGGTAKAIADDSKLDQERVTHYLDVLSSSEARILEKVDQAGKYSYRLANPLFIPALTALLMETAQKADSITKLFNLHYKQWKRDPREINLLRRKDLKKIEVQMRRGKFRLRGPDINDKAGYLDKSKQKRHRRRVRIAVLGVSILVVLVVAGGSVSHWLDVREMHHKLSSWQLPPDLFERQFQLTSISIDRTEMRDLTWLRSASINEVTITSSSLGTLNGIQNLSSVQKLAIDFGNCDTKHLSLQKIAKLNLTDLEIDHLGHCNEPEISGMASLPELKTLTLDLEGTTLEAIPGLDQLRELSAFTLNCKSSKLLKLPALGRGLRHLSLYLDDSAMTDFSSLSNIEQLESLTLSLNDSAFKNLPAIFRVLRSVARLDLYINISPITDLPDLRAVQGVSTVALHLDNIKIQNMENLSSLQGIQQLELFLNFSPLNNLDILRKLSELKKIELHLKSTDIQQLPEIFDHAENVILELNMPPVKYLPILGNDLLNLEINMGTQLKTPGARKLEIGKLAKLKTLNLDLSSSSQAWDLMPLADLYELTTVALRLNWSQASGIGNLTQLPKLKDLTISLGGFGVQDLMFLNDFQAVEDLTLNLEETNLNKFPDISRMRNLQHLKLNLEKSHIRDLSQLSLPSGLQTLDLDVAHSYVQILPNMAQLQQLRIKLDISHSKIADLNQIRALPKLEELTLDKKFQSLQALPPSVKKLNFVQ